MARPFINFPLWFKCQSRKTSLRTMLHFNEGKGPMLRLAFGIQSRMTQQIGH